MAHKLETAHISFGLVTIPVGIYPAIQEQDIHFNQLHGVCGSRIQQRRFCPTCNRDVEYDELVKGYEIAKEQYVQLTLDDFEQLQAAESEAMEIVEFVPLTASILRTPITSTRKTGREALPAAHARDGGDGARGLSQVCLAGQGRTVCDSRGARPLAPPQDALSG